MKKCLFGLLSMAALSWVTLASHGAIITVNSTNDPAGFNPAITIGGLGSTVTLRDAFNAAVNAGGANTIVFDPALAGTTIALQQIGGSYGMSALALQNNTHPVNLTIQGLTNGPGVTIARAGTTNKFRLFLCDVNNTWSHSLTINDLTLTGGEVPSGNWGGAILNIDNCTMTLNRCTLTGNSAYFGGALYNRFSPVYLNNCTITGNTADDQGGGIYIYVSQTRLNNCTVSDNLAQQAGGLYSFNSGSATLVNTIISSNRATISFPDVLATLNGASQNNLIGGDARLGPLADNGGPTKTMALLAGSPAINAGVAIGGITTDQRGQPIFQAPDIGAYEYPPSPPTISSPNSTTFFSGIFNSFTFISDGNPLSTFSVTGALPAGVTLSTNGILSGTPTLGTEGIYPLTVTAANVDTNSNPQSADQTFTLTVTRVGLEVTTTADEDDGTSDPGTGAGTSLREAVNYAATFTDTQTVTFASGLAGQTIVLTNGLVLTNSMTIYGPSDAPGVTIDGAGLYRPFTINNFITVTLENLTITRGRATGAAIYSRGRLRLNRCLLTGNSTTGDGSALFIFEGDARVANCTIADNSGTFGGAIYNNSVLSLVNCTVVSNRNNIGANYSAGILNWNAGPTRLYLTNCIVANNINLAFPSAADFAGKAVEASSANNLIGSAGTAGLVNGTNGNIVGVADAGVMALASNGGPTRTMALAPASLALNTGTPVPDIATDQRGFARTVGTAPDIGAFEDATGDDDPDRDTLGNVAEYFLGTNPMHIDSDSDGFNDATEQFNGSSPTNTASIPPTNRIERVLGYGPARGLDLSGNFVRAFNVSSAGAAGIAGDATFTADTASGIAVSAPNDIPNWISPDFGSSADDVTLATVFRSIRWADTGNSDPNLRNVVVTLYGLTPGQGYKLQLLFGEANYDARAFDIFVQGSNLVHNFRPYAAQGGAPVYACSAVVCELVATGTVLEVVLDGTVSDVGTDRNPILNGVTLEVLPPVLVSQPPGFVSVTFGGGTNGAISAIFTNTPFAGFTAYGSTNVMLPLNLWPSLGPATETPAGSGTYQISVPVGTNAPEYFLRVDSP